MNWTGLAATAWDPSGGDEPQWDHDFYRRIIEQSRGPALDVGCGTGRLLLRYLAAGLDVEGIDTSPDMLAICREKAARQGLHPTLHVQAMQELELPRRFRTIMVPCGSFVLLTDLDQAFEALRRFWDHLEPGGLLLLPLFSPFSHGEPLSDVPNGGDHEWGIWHRAQLPDGGEMIQHIERLSIDRVEQLLVARRRYRLVRGGEVIAEEIFDANERWYHRNEMRLMLEKVGFEVLRVCGDFTEEAFASHHVAMVFTAQKPHTAAATSREEAGVAP